MRDTYAWAFLNASWEIEKDSLSYIVIIYFFYACTIFFLHIRYITLSDTIYNDRDKIEEIVLRKERTHADNIVKQYGSI